jgi:peptidoglycan-associated lipoprotein
MKLASQKLCLVVASAALALVGCTKKPTRPNPSETLIGPNGTRGTGIDMGSGRTDVNLGAVDPLPARTEGFGVDGQNRTALQGQTVYFDFDKYDLKAPEREKLKAAKDYLDKNPTHRLLLEGHCDWRGTAEYNLALGDRRAAAAKKYLQTIGVKPERLETLSKGSLEAAKNADDSTMAKDRRVDLVVMDPSRAASNPL